MSVPHVCLAHHIKNTAEAAGIMKLEGEYFLLRLISRRRDNDIGWRNHKIPTHNINIHKDWATSACQQSNQYLPCETIKVMSKHSTHTNGSKLLERIFR